MVQDVVGDQPQDRVQHLHQLRQYLSEVRDIALTRDDIRA